MHAWEIWLEVFSWNTLTSALRKSCLVGLFSRTREYQRCKRAVGPGCKRKPAQSTGSIANDRSMKDTDTMNSSRYDLSLIVERCPRADSVSCIQQGCMLYMQDGMQSTSSVGQVVHWACLKSNNDGKWLMRATLWVDVLPRYKCIPEVDEPSPVWLWS